MNPGAGGARSSPRYSPKATTTTTATLTNSGFVSEFSPGADKIVIRTATSVSPITYQFTETTTYADAAGKPVAIETVKSGALVTIYYWAR